MPVRPIIHYDQLLNLRSKTLIGTGANDADLHFKLTTISNKFL